MTTIMLFILLMTAPRSSSTEFYTMPDGNQFPMLETQSVVMYLLAHDRAAAEPVAQEMVARQFPASDGWRPPTFQVHDLVPLDVLRQVVKSHEGKD